ncbi:MAG TPA: hypothetical protein VNG51_01370 [Ktedonobacteraceae bacterium]|nr:hypothetical protein [Ktedonobacteraceae bacterium]
MPQEPTEYSAFSPTCHQVQHVTAALISLGFHLTFTLPAHTYKAAPPVPAQYHYEDTYSTEVIYLAGKDTPLDNDVFPLHASRFLAYPGSHPPAFRTMKRTLTVLFLCSWIESSKLQRQRQEKESA